MPLDESVPDAALPGSSSLSTDFDDSMVVFFDRLFGAAGFSSDVVAEGPAFGLGSDFGAIFFDLLALTSGGGGGGGSTTGGGFSSAALRFRVFLLTGGS